MMKRPIYIFLMLLSLLPFGVAAQPLSERYNASRPLVVVCDWDKPPYEFRDDRGNPAGTNIDLLKAITKELGIPCEFVMKEWTTAIKTFERGEADLILANVRRYRLPGYYSTENVINYNRICVATVADSSHIVTRSQLLEQGVVLKYGDYVSFFFRDTDSALSPKVEFQSPKVALQGLHDGDYRYFVWGEEPLKWKIKELSLKDVSLNDVDIPVSEIHIIGRDSTLIFAIDDYYSRLKQSGEVQRINDRWLHPERDDETAPSWLVVALLAFLLLGIIVYGFNRMARAHVKSATRNSRELNGMMYKALHMGNIHVMEYDIRRDRMTNRYGKPMLPERGITLQEFTEHIHPHEVDEFRQKMQMLMNGRERKFELRKSWKSFNADEWLILEGHAIVELDHEGRPAYIINAVSDVTKSVEEDRTARELVRKYETLSNMPFMAMSFYDKDGWLIDLNDPMRELCGITPDNPDSQRYWLTVCMFDIPLFRSAYSPGARHDLLACMHMDYPEMGVNRYIEYHVGPLFNGEGEVANYFCSTLDITAEHERYRRMQTLEREIRQTQQRVDRYESWLNFLTKQGNTYLWYSDIARRTAYFFRSLQGSAPDDYIVMPFETYLVNMPEAERPAVEAELTNQNPAQQPFDSIHHFQNTLLDSGESWFRISGTPIFDAQGHVTGHRGQSLDVTQEMSAKKRLAEETQLARDSVRLKSAFLASMTHELRTPLNAIIGFTDILGDVPSVEERNEYIRIIHNNCDMLQRLISDILAASALNEGPTSIEQTDVDFAKAFDDICLTLQHRPEPGVEFVKDNPYHTFYTTLDIGRVNQVITNFVTNAVKFTHQGHVRLSYRYERHGLMVSCEDTGVGIPPEKQGIIFDRFVKLDEFVQGTGMGLSICKTIAERLGGEIGVRSEGKDRGSTFWIWIPCDRRLTPQTTNTNQENNAEK